MNKKKLSNRWDCDYCGFSIHFLNKDNGKYIFQCGDCGHIYEYACEDLADRLLEDLGLYPQ